ncbi:MAG: malto-oligosyltrehalose synthase [Frankiales bacterium]|nr:malto-oligosyltrehalose synthase [Frankiales bacterium]
MSSRGRSSSSSKCSDVPPTATYRLQLHRDFGFADAAAVVPYLADLGVSHVYCSPVLEAAPGSMHGYDVVDHDRLSLELGGTAGWRQLTDACRAAGLGIVIDIVPNHMAVPTPEDLNVALWDVLRAGSASRFAGWFDIDWAAGGGRILLPVLGKPVDECIAAGELSVDGAEIRYADHRFPIAPESEDLAGDISELLAHQHYELAFWRRAATELNYRRFFDVTTLIGVRVEDPDVFDATHRVPLALVAAGDVDGLRIDHPDGLADPSGYLDRLAKASGGTWTVVEKILEPGERLPRDWRCDGTTGYDTITAISQLFVDPAGAKPLTDIYADLTGEPTSYAEVVSTAKRQVLETLFAAEVDRLVRDFTASGSTLTSPPAVRDAVVELLVAFEVYRAYAGDPASEQRLLTAAEHATTARQDLAGDIRDITDVLRGEDPATAAFRTRFAQTTGPVMAKGVEDTAFYRYLRLVALNEVGGDPGTFGSPIEAWHEHCRRITDDFPTTMTTLSTHDTKRSEDVRARLFVLAEIPAEWAAAVRRWRDGAAQHGTIDRPTDYLLWQTLVGAWPLPTQRLQDYLEKATHEAKLRTSWTDPDQSYDAELRSYVERLLSDDALLGDVGEFVEQHLRIPGEANALSQKLVQLAMPGVPDVYQGQELPDLSLVDPDNRRPVDFAQRRDALAAIDSGVATVEPKLRVTTAALRLRRSRPALLRDGDYAPVAVTGAAAEHAIAFRRVDIGGGSGDDVIVVATRLPVGLQRRGGWQDTELDAASLGTDIAAYRDVLTGRPGVAPLGELLADLPVALLVRDEG